MAEHVLLIGEGGIVCLGSIVGLLAFVICLTMGSVAAVLGGVFMRTVQEETLYFIGCAVAFQVGYDEPPAPCACSGGDGARDSVYQMGCAELTFSTPLGYYGFFPLLSVCIGVCSYANLLCSCYGSRSVLGCSHNRCVRPSANVSPYKPARTYHF